MRSQVKTRLRAGAIHLSISFFVSAIAGLVVFGLWYPYPYREISGGRELFMILIAVDLAIGPFLTILVFDRAKIRRELIVDLGVIGIIQVAALSYGLWSVFVARPVHLVFEYSKFTVVHAVDIAPEFLAMATPELRHLPWTGPTTIALRPFKNSQEQLDFTLAALNGVPLAARSDLWQPYAASAPSVLMASRSLTELLSRFPEATDQIATAVSDTRRTASSLRYVPMVGREQAWTVLIDAASAQPLAYLRLDSF